jgi:hypothetical protein
MGDEEQVGRTKFIAARKTRNIEHGFTLGHSNINCLHDEKIETGNVDIKRKSDGSFTSRPIEPKGKVKRVPSDPRLSGKL